MPAISGATDAAIGYIDQLANAYENHGVNGLLDEAGEVFAEISVKAAAEAPRMVEAAVDFVENTVDGLAAHKGELVEAYILHTFQHRSKLSFFTKEIYSYIIQFVQGV